MPIETLRVGSAGTGNMLELAARYGAGFLHASTSECYGDPLEHPQREEYWGHVNPVGPRSVYDEAKRYAEALVMAYHRARGVNTHLARIFNTYGPRLHPFDGRVISNFLMQALRGEPLTIYGDGSQTRSFCYVDDLIEGFMRLAQSEEHLPVNLGNPGEFTILECARTVLEVTGSKSELKFEPLPVDDPTRRCPDISKARRLLGWEPRSSAGGTGEVAGLLQEQGGSRSLRGACRGPGGEKIHSSGTHLGGNERASLLCSFPCHTPRSSKTCFNCIFPFLRRCLRPVIVYIALVMLLRVFGKRELAQLNPFDPVVLLSLANTVQNAIIGNDNSVTGGIIGAIALLGINWLVVRTAFRSRRVSHLLEGRATVLIRNGQVDKKALSRELMTRDELLQVVREQGFTGFHQVRKGELEPDGRFSIEGFDPSIADKHHSELLERLDTMGKEIAALRGPLAEGQ